MSSLRSVPGDHLVPWPVRRATAALGRVTVAWHRSLCSARWLERNGPVSRRSMPQWLREVFTALAAINLEWLADILRLEPPDGGSGAFNGMPGA